MYGWNQQKKAIIGPWGMTKVGRNGKWWIHILCGVQYPVFFQGISKFSTPKSRSNLLKNLEHDGNGGRKRGPEWQSILSGLSFRSNPIGPLNNNQIIGPGHSLIIQQPKIPGKSPDLTNLRSRLSAHTTNGPDGTQSSEIPQQQLLTKKAPHGNVHVQPMAMKMVINGSNKPQKWLWMVHNTAFHGNAKNMNHNGLGKNVEESQKKSWKNPNSFNMWKVSPYSHGVKLPSESCWFWSVGRSSQEEHTEASASCRYDFRAPLKSAGCPRIKASDFKNHSPPNLTRRPSFQTSSFPFPQIWMKHDEGYLWISVFNVFI